MWQRYLLLGVILMSSATALLSDYVSVSTSGDIMCSGETIYNINGINVSNCLSYINITIKGSIPQKEINQLSIQFEFNDTTTKTYEMTSVNSLKRVPNSTTLGFTFFNYFGENCANYTLTDDDGSRYTQEQCYPGLTEANMTGMANQLKNAAAGETYKYAIQGVKTPRNTVKWGIYVGDIYIDPVWAAPDGDIVVIYSDGTSKYRVINATTGLANTEQSAGTISSFGGKASSIPNHNITAFIMAANNNKSISYLNMSPVSLATTFYTNQGENIRHDGEATCPEDLSGNVIIPWSTNTVYSGMNVSIFYLGNLSLTQKTVTSDNDASTGRYNRQLYCTPRRGTNEFVLFGVTNGSNQTFAMVWNNTSQEFYDVLNLSGVNEGDTGSETGNTPRRLKTVHCGYETISGLLNCFYTNTSNTAGTVYVRTRNATENGGGWNNPQTISVAEMAAVIEYVNVASNPLSNEMLLTIGTSTNASIEVWNGNTLTNHTRVTSLFVNTAQDQSQYALFPIVYRYFPDNTTTTEAAAVFRITSSAAPRMIKWNGSTPSSVTTLPAVSSVSTDDIWYHFLTPNIDGNNGVGNSWAYYLACDESADLNAAGLNSTNLTNMVELETTLAGNCVGRTPPWIEWGKMDNSAPNATNYSINDTTIVGGAGEIILVNITVRDNWANNLTFVSTNETGVWTNYSTTSGRFCTHFQSTYWMNCPMNVTITNTTAGTYGLITHSLDGRGNEMIMASQNITVTSSGSLCSGSSDCIIDCSTTSSVPTDEDVGGFNVYFNNSGPLSVTARIHNFKNATALNGCDVTTSGAGRIG